MVFRYQNAVADVDANRYRLSAAIRCVVQKPVSELCLDRCRFFIVQIQQPVALSERCERLRLHRDRVQLTRVDKGNKGVVIGVALCLILCVIKVGFIVELHFFFAQVITCRLGKILPKL